MTKALAKKLFHAAIEFDKGNGLTAQSYHGKWSELPPVSKLYWKNLANVARSYDASEAAETGRPDTLDVKFKLHDPLPGQTFADLPPGVFNVEVAEVTESAKVLTSPKALASNNLQALARYLDLGGEVDRAITASYIAGAAAALRRLPD